MRNTAKLGLEVLFAALLYVAGNLTLGAISFSPSAAGSVVPLALLHALAFAAVAIYGWRVDGSWWSVGGSAVLALVALQVVVPRLEMAQERHQAVRQLPATAVFTGIAAAVAIGAVLLMVSDASPGSGVPPYPWPLGSPVSYAWRPPAVAMVYAGLHVTAMRVGRAMFGQIGRASFSEEMVGRLLCGSAVALVLLAMATHLEVRTLHRVAFLPGVTVWVGVMRRWALVYTWSAPTIVVRLGLRGLADLLVVAAAAWLLLPSKADVISAAALAPAAAAPRSALLRTARTHLPSSLSRSVLPSAEASLSACTARSNHGAP